MASDYQIIFRWMFEHGLGLPVCSFLRGLFHFYKIEFVNLNPNSLLHLSLFVHACEDFLGVRPHFDLFRVLFVVHPLLSASNRVPLGGVGIRLRKASPYFPVKLLTSNSVWKAQWFFCDNSPPPLPDCNTNIASVEDNWSLTKEELKELLNKYEVK